MDLQERGEARRALGERGYDVSDSTVLRLFKRLGYSLQANQKTREGADHPDRDAQFQHINQTVDHAIRHGQPAISVDTKKRELIGDFKAVGRELEPKGKPRWCARMTSRIRTSGTRSPTASTTCNTTRDGSMSVWTATPRSSPPRAFAAGGKPGKQRFPNARELTITADAGGSNSYRTRLWKVELQKLADATGLKITSLIPSGTSKWNKIEHRLFSFIRPTGAESP